MKRDQNLTIANVSRSLLPTLAFTLLLASPAIGQTTPPAPATTAPAAAPAAAAPAAPPSLTISAPSAAPEPKALAKSWVQVSGILDGYYDYDSNNPANGSTNPTAGPNTYTYIRNFDIRANTVSLTEAKITLSHDPGWFGFRTDIGLGSVFQVMHQSGNPTGTGLKYVEQMYVATKPPKWKGFEADFGQFTTSAGAEVIESGDNWNYSRSLLFANAIPYYHFGLRTSIPIGSAFTGGVQVVQGWNNIFDNNSGKTIGITGVYAKKYYTWSANYYVGPENNNTNFGKRNLIDTTLLLTPTGKINAYLNYDYGQNRNATYSLAGVGTGTADLAHWQGFAGAAHGQLTSKLTATFRGEYYFFSDPAGVKGYIPTKLTEETLTGDYLFYPGILLRAEYRHDGSNLPVFDKNKAPASATGQNTFDIALIFSFGPKT
jgi:hypothetical protein